MMEWAPRRRLTPRAAGRSHPCVYLLICRWRTLLLHGCPGPWRGCPRLTCSPGDTLCHNGISVIVATRTATRWLRTSPPHPHGCGDGLWRFGRRVVAHTSKLSHRSVRQDVDGLFKDVAARYRVLQAPHEMQWAIPTG